MALVLWTDDPRRHRAAASPATVLERVFVWAVLTVVPWGVLAYVLFA